MSDAKFNKIIDYDALKQAYGDTEAATASSYDALSIPDTQKPKNERRLIKG